MVDLFSSQRESDQSIFHLLVHSQKVSNSQNQDPGTPSWSRMYVAGLQAHRPHTATQDALTGNYIESRGDGTQTHSPVWNGVSQEATFLAVPQCPSPP